MVYNIEKSKRLPGTKDQQKYKGPFKVIKITKSHVFGVDKNNPRAKPRKSKDRETRTIQSPQTNLMTPDSPTNSTGNASTQMDIIQLSSSIDESTNQDTTGISPFYKVIQAMSDLSVLEIVSEGVKNQIGRQPN